MTPGTTPATLAWMARGAHRRRRVAVGVALGLLGASCLFPSFDRLAPSGVSTKNIDASAASSGSEGGTGNGDAEAGAVAREVACGSTSCSIPTTFCCVTIGGPACQDRGTEVFCGTVEGGDVLRCDGDEGCDPGLTCCFLTQDSEARCASDCNGGQVLCNGPTHACPADKSCTGTVAQGHRACR
jgi:hypothetical protein